MSSCYYLKNAGWCHGVVILRGHLCLAAFIILEQAIYSNSMYDCLIYDLYQKDGSY